MKWLCCQLGAREHYAIPRALFRLNLLDRLVTDAWVPPSSFLGKVCGRRLADRFHGDLREARVIAFNSSLILFEMLARARALNEWKVGSDPAGLRTAGHHSSAVSSQTRAIVWCAVHARAADARAFPRPGEFAQGRRQITRRRSNVAR